MPTSNRRENAIISLFLSAYENDSWCDSIQVPLDEIQDGAPEIHATRRSDGKTLVIEHTLIQPFDAHKQEFARLQGLRSIEQDQSLVVPGRSIIVYIAAGVLQRGNDWGFIKKAVRSWLDSNVHSLEHGDTRHRVSVKPGTEVALLTRVHELNKHPGMIRLGIDGSWLPHGSLGRVVEKALRTKLKKLLKPSADKRILLLERDEFTLPEAAILREIERLRPSLSDLNRIDEIWFAETVFFQAWGSVEFHDGTNTRVLAFDRGKLVIRHD
jgi:hypothetical protein